MEISIYEVTMIIQEQYRKVKKKQKNLPRFDEKTNTADFVFFCYF